MNDNTETPPNNHVELATQIVASYVANNSVPTAELPT
jgi:predicted transcriptional regulator